MTIKKPVANTSVIVLGLTLNLLQIYSSDPMQMMGNNSI